MLPAPPSTERAEGVLIKGGEPVLRDDEEEEGGPDLVEEEDDEEEQQQQQEEEETYQMEVQVRNYSCSFCPVFTRKVIIMCIL